MTIPGPRLHYPLRRPISWAFVVYAAWKSVVWWLSPNRRSSSSQYATLTRLGRQIPAVGSAHPMWLWAILWTAACLLLAGCLGARTKLAATVGLLGSMGMNASFSFSLSVAAFHSGSSSSYDTLGTLILLQFFHGLAIYLTWAEW